MEISYRKEKTFQIVRCTSLFAKKRTSLFANYRTSLIAKKCTLLFAIYNFTVVVLYTNQFGLNGILVDKDHRTLMHFTSHFLDRYNKRFLKNEGASHLELLKRFIPANSVQTIKSFHKNSSASKQIFGRFHEGVGLGFKEAFPERGKVLYHFNTFISNEMVLRHQIEDYNTLGKLYDGLQEEGYVRGRKCA